ncbi:hypothetical protein ACX0G9_11095 [Flavitalea flava]
MEKLTGMTRKQAFFLMLLFFVLSILIRLPNLNRPLSKHHEYNTAVILINLESWRQGGGGSRFHFIPLMNYQNPGDKRMEQSPLIDSSGNTIYLSFGPGWYIIPYFFYQVFHLPVKAVYLQVINLFSELAAMILLFFLCEKLIPAGYPKKYAVVFMACFLFMFSPGILWYLGNGYVTTGIMMPFVMGYLLLLIPMLQSPENIRISRLLLLALLVIILVYLDWFVLFLSAMSSLYLLTRIRKQKKMGVLLLILILASAAGISLLYLQFTSYLSPEQVILYWEQRFQNRSITNKGGSFGSMAGSSVRNLVTAYFPVLVLVLMSFTRLRLKKISPDFSAREILFAGLYISSILVYNLVFLEWTSEHEFALIPLSLLLVFWGARLTMIMVGHRGFYAIIAAYFIIACSQYYFINRPGKISMDGTPYDTYEKFGRQLQHIPMNQHLFMDKSWTAAIDFYAKRTITRMANPDSARAYIRKWGVTESRWIEQDNFQLKKVIPLW